MRISLIWQYNFVHREAARTSPVAVHGRSARCARDEATIEYLRRRIPRHSRNHGRDAKQAGLGVKPLAVVSAGEQKPAWLKLKDELAARSFNSIHCVVEGATHASLLFDRRDVQVTSAAILKVVEAVCNDRAHSW